MLNTVREIQELPYKRRSVTFCWRYNMKHFPSWLFAFYKKICNAYYAWPLQFSPNIKENVVKQ